MRRITTTLTLVLLLTGPAAHAQPRTTTTELKYRFIVPVRLSGIMAQKAIVSCALSYQQNQVTPDVVPKDYFMVMNQRAEIALRDGAFDGTVEVEMSVPVGAQFPTNGSCALGLGTAGAPLALATKAALTSAPEWRRAKPGTSFRNVVSLLLDANGRPLASTQSDNVGPKK